MALQNIHASPPQVAHDGQGFGSDFKPCTIARPPNRIEVATTDIAWLVSSVPIEDGSIIELILVSFARDVEHALQLLAIIALDFN